MLTWETSPSGAQGSERRPDGEVHARLRVPECVLTTSEWKRGAGTKAIRLVPTEDRGGERELGSRGRHDFRLGEDDAGVRLERRAAREARRRARGEDGRTPGAPRVAEQRQG